MSLTARTLLVSTLTGIFLASCSSASLGPTPGLGSDGIGNVAGVAALADRAAPAKTAKKGYAVLYAFGGTPDGADPVGGVILDANNNIFGTTYTGGTAVPPTGGAGTLFELAYSKKGYAESILHSFGSDGYYPAAAPAEDAEGNLYASLEAGPAGDSAGGVVQFGGTNGYPEAQHFSFAAGQGSTPQTSPFVLVTGSAYRKPPLGYLTLYYLTANQGGAYGYGSLVTLTPNFVFGDVHDFQGGPSDGAGPLGNLAVNPEGPGLGVFGATSAGGAYGNGTVFRWDPDTTTYSIVYSFQGGTTDGSSPAGGVVLDDNGNIYGTTQGGGANGTGVVFKLTANQSGGYTESILHSFGAAKDGTSPHAAPVLALKGKLLYGTTSAGGKDGAGTIYQVSTTGTKYKVLYSFAAATGSIPGYGSLAVTTTALYGTTESGGAHDDGVVYCYTL
jgi:uncharacterized repeat protein (TIGR03803 family)